MKKLLFIILLLPVFASAANKYVDSSYTGTSTGTFSQPYKTLANVNTNISSINAGDTVFFKRNYKYAGVLNITRSGTNGAPIVFSSYGTGVDAEFIGTGSHQNYLFQIQNRSWVTFDHITINDPTLDPNDHFTQDNIDVAIQIDKSKHVVVQNCSISQIGVGVNIIGDSCIVKNNTIRNLRMINNTPTNVNSDDDYGGYAVGFSGSYNDVYGNLFKDCWAESYDYSFDGGGIEVFDLGSGNQFSGGCNNNKVHHNTFYHCMGIAEYGSSVGGSSDSTFFYYNNFEDCNEIFINNSGTYNIAASNILLYNNNFIQQDAFFAPVASTQILNTKSTSAFKIFDMKNCVWWLRNGVDVAKSSLSSGGQLGHDYNVFNLGSGSALNFTAGAHESTTSSAIWNSTSGSNSFVWDYRTVSGSPATAAGTTISVIPAVDYIGNPIGTPPNAGAYGPAVAPTGRDYFTCPCTFSQ